MKQGWLMLTAVAGLGFLAGCAKETTAPAADAAPAEAQHGPELVITSEAEFAEKVEGASGVVLVDFWATWCPPCKIMNPILAELAADYAGRLVVAKVDVDQHRALAERFKIESIPTLIVFKDGKTVDMRVGALRKDALRQWVDEQLAP